MKHWINYFIERFSPLFSLAVITGIALTGVIIDKHPFLPIPFIASSLLLFYIAFFLRLQNDLHDIEKDKVAFPDRILPRGDMGKKEAIYVAEVLHIGLFIYFALLFVFFDVIAKLSLLITAGYFWLLMHDFYKGDLLRKHTFIQVTLQQAFIIPLTLSVISLGLPSYVFSLQGISYAVMLFGSFFTFEICRKLNPFSHPISLSLVHYFGFRSIYRLALGLLALTAIGAYGFGVHYILWPCELGVAVALTWVRRNPRKFRFCVIAGGLSLLMHAWAGLLT